MGRGWDWVGKKKTVDKRSGDLSGELRPLLSPLALDSTAREQAGVMTTSVIISAGISLLYGNRDRELQNESCTGTEKTVVLFPFNNRGREYKQFTLKLSPLLPPLVQQVLRRACVF